MNWFSKHLEISHGSHAPLRPMEGLRGIAVFLVFLVHYCTLIEPFIIINTIESASLFYVHKVGNVGVDLFFVLSGFLIYGTLISKSKTRFLPYMERRIKRIYPTFIVVLSIYLFLSFVFPSESKIPKDVFEGSVYLIQNILLLPGIFNIEPIITVAWSLSYEVFYYLLIPILISLLRMRHWTPLNRVVFWLIISILGFGLFYKFGGPYRLLMFVSGIILYELYKHFTFRLPNHLGTFSLIIALAVTAYSQVIKLNGIISLSFIFILFLVVCLEAFKNNNGSAKWLNIAVLRWLGNMSYSYYLLHGLALKASFLLLSKVIPPAQQFEALFWIALPVMFISTFIPSLLLFLFVEKPLSINR